MSKTVTAPPNHRLKEVRHQFGYTQAELGKAVGMSQNAIYKIERGDQRMTTENLEAFGKALGISPADLLPRHFFGEKPQSAYLPEPEARKYDAKPASHNENDLAKRIISQLIDDFPNRSAWTLNTDLLNASGYNMGDTLIVDATARPDIGDVVCAQLYSRGGSDTIFRIYHTPYLLPSNKDGKLASPILLDAQKVRIVGTVTESLRARGPVKH